MDPTRARATVIPQVLGGCLLAFGALGLLAVLVGASGIPALERADLHGGLGRREVEELDLLRGLDLGMRSILAILQIVGGGLLIQRHRHAPRAVTAFAVLKPFAVVIVHLALARWFASRVDLSDRWEPQTFRTVALAGIAWPALVLVLVRLRRVRDACT